jgi:hypothetical protein
MTVRTYRVGDVVFNHGEQGNEYFVIARGRVSIKVPTLLKYNSKEAMIQGIADNYENVIWRTVENPEDIRFLA